MTITDVLEMARKAGGHDGFTGPPTDWDEGNFVISPEGLLKFAALVRTAALEEAARVTREFAQKWWSIHCASNKHMETTRKAHDDFCALQAAIRAMKEQL